MDELFRPEAMAHASRRLTGPVILGSPISVRIFSLLAIVAVAGAALFLSVATYARKETVQGLVAPAEGLVRVAAQTGGLVEEILVAEGEVVTAGQAMATLRIAPDLDNRNLGEAVVGAVAREQAAAQAGAEAAEQGFASEAAALRRSRALLATQQAEAARAIDLQANRVRLAQETLSNYEAMLSRDAISAQEVRQVRGQFLEEQATLSALRQSQIGLANQIAEVDARLTAIASARARSRAAEDTVRAQIDQRAADAEGRTRVTLTSPRAGMVAALPARTGQTLAPGATLAVVAPPGALQVELYAPSRAAGFIAAGQPVRILYQAFPYQRFGAGAGEVSAVSRTVLAPGEVELIGARLTEPVFRVDVRLERDYVDAYGARAPLQPGMLVTADIIVDRRTLLEWLLDPIYAAGRRG